MNDTVIHIGYPKTGTTWFQKQLYPKVKNYTQVSKNIVYEKLIKPSVFNFDSVLTAKYFKENYGKIIISEELLLGGIDIGFGNGFYIKQIACRLKDVFPNGRVVIFIRNQVDLIASWYSQYVKSGGTYSVKRFLFGSDLFLPYKCYNLFSMQILYYGKIIELYCSLFGRDNVDIYLYEDFFERKEEFVAEICNKYNFIIPDSLNDYVHNRLNRRFGAFALQIIRFLNRFTYKNTVYKQYFLHIPLLFELSFSFFSRLGSHWPFRANGSNSSILSKDVVEYIEEYYKDSNRVLLEKYDLKNVEKYGYTL